MVDKNSVICFFVLCLFHGLISHLDCLSHASDYPTYYIDDTAGLGRTFDGIGAISGGGATSKLLMNYQQVYRDQILDYLFKPNFAASLQILKVEIGGDSQSTDGSEASHMHDSDDENYNRGYEWFMMKEAKKRNPSIKLYGLPWVWPGWLGGDDFNPFSNRTNTVRYLVNWVRGAKETHNLTIDYVGVWNERTCDYDYIKMLREGLDSAGFSHVQIVACDGSGWGMAEDILKDPKLLHSVDILGSHYPASMSSLSALAVDRPLWSSEEFSAYNDISGGACWARILNEGYINGFLTGTIAWNLITSYYDNLPYPRSSLMTANQPWSGAYDVASPIWMTAHHTQFTSPGWQYLLHGMGVGNLTMNGSYVAMTSPDRQQLTLIITTMDPEFAHCFYSMPKYTIKDQYAKFYLKGSYAKIKHLNVWLSRLQPSGENTMFHKMAPISVNSGLFELYLETNTVITLTTLDTGVHGSLPDPPSPQPFPVPYRDDFEAYTEQAEPYNLAQQAGGFAVVPSGDSAHGNVIMQTVPQPPVDTCRPERMPKPVAVFGNYQWSDVMVEVDFYVKSDSSWSDGVFLGARVATGGCWIMYSEGVFVWLFPHNKTILLTANFTRSYVYDMKEIDIEPNHWYTLGLYIQNDTVMCRVDKKMVLLHKNVSFTSKNGFLALGTNSFAQAYFDNLVILNATAAQNPEKPVYNYQYDEQKFDKNYKNKYQHEIHEKYRKLDKGYNKIKYDKILNEV